MKEIKRNWDKLTIDQRQKAIKEVITFFDEQQDEEIGVIAAEQMLDFFLENIGVQLYNKGINDAKELLKEKIDDLDIELDLLINKE